MSVQGAGEAQGFDSYIIGLREHASPDALLQLRPGAPLRLCPGRDAGRHRLEIRTLQGEPLGWLPAEDGMALEQYPSGWPGLAAPAPKGRRGAELTPPSSWTAEVLALVPARLLPRVHIRIFIPAHNLVA